MGLFKKKKPPELWDNFLGVKNTQEVINDKISALATAIVEISYETTKSLIEWLQKDCSQEIKTDFFVESYTEIAILLVHFSDRYAFMYLPEKRDEFIDKLMSLTGEYLVDGFENESARSAIANYYKTTLNERQLEYSKYKKLVPDSNEGTKDTLWWEFSKKVMFKKEWNYNPAYIMYLVTVIGDWSIYLNLRKLFTGKK